MFHPTINNSSLNSEQRSFYAEKCINGLPLVLGNTIKVVYNIYEYGTVYMNSTVFFELYCSSTSFQLVY